MLLRIFIDLCLEIAPILQIGERRLQEPLREDVFGSLMLQRAMLKRDQQLAEWICC